MRRKENNSEHKKDKNDEKHRKTSKNKTLQDARQMGTNVHLSEKSLPKKANRTKIKMDVQVNGENK